jgi:thiol-disulfide isomerase/thioredoxin
VRAALLAIVLLARAAQAEPLALVDLEGRPAPVAPAPDGAVVAHFWATWCPSCRDELPVLDRAAAACPGIEVIAVDVGEDRDEVAAYLAERPLALRVLRDPDGRAWRASGGREMPANLIWNAAGRRWALGPSSAAQWRERFAALGCANAPPHGPE